MEEKIKEIIRRVAKLDQERELPRDADLFAELGLDSLTGLRILGEIEEHFDIELPEESLAELTSVSAIKSAMEKTGVSD